MTDDFLVVNDKIPEIIKNGTIIDINASSVTKYTHGFHKYPGKFIPNLPKWAIEKYLYDDAIKLIMDPFCGSGTTLVEGLLSGHNVIGIDVDPLSTLISKVKTTVIDKVELEKISSWLLDNLENVKPNFKPDCETISHWFTDDAIDKLSKIRTLIDNIYSEFGEDKTNKDIKEFLLICLSSIIRKVSNADNQSQKTYVSGTKPKEPDEVYESFKIRLDMYKERLILLEEKIGKDLKSKVICGQNNYELDKKINFDKVDLIVSSPPYIKSVDYVYNQMAELFWIGDIFNMQTQVLQNEKKKEYTGTMCLFKKEYADYTPFNDLLNIEELDKSLQYIYLNDTKNGHKYAYITYKYFCDMELHFKEAYKCMKNNSHYIMIVGDSKVSSLLIKTSDFLTNIAERNGFKAINRWGYKIKNHYMGFDRKGRGGKIEIDWVIDFVKI